MDAGSDVGKLDRLARTILLVALAGGPVAIHGQTTSGADVTRLPGVQVIGTTPLNTSGIAPDKAPQRVQTLTSDDIDRTHAPDVTDLLNRSLGSVYVNGMQNNPFQPDVGFRGFTASPLLGTPQGLSVYVDGIRINQPFGDVVSWDLVPRSAIEDLTLISGSNPVFGRNTLGGAISVRTKDGWGTHGTSVEGEAGGFGRNIVRLEAGGSGENGASGYLAIDRLHEQGWRTASPSDLAQAFGKVGWRSATTRLTLSLGLADNRLTGNGLQEAGLLSQARASVYTLPDTTHNRSAQLNLMGEHRIADGVTLSGNLYFRAINTATSNGDVNDDALDQSIYQPNAAEVAALRAAGYTGVPTSGSNAANTPFPKFRCIANALRRDEPGEKCTGIIGTSSTRQSDAGFNVQLDHRTTVFGRDNTLVSGVAFDRSEIRFGQGSELGFLNADRSVTGVGAFGDGVTGGNIDGVPFDTRVFLTSHTTSAGLFIADTLAVTRDANVTLSGRYDHTRVSMNDHITPGGGPGSLDGVHTFSRFNPALGITFQPVPALVLYGNVGQGSRAPSAIELGCADPANPCKLPNAMTGDPPLKQVVATTAEFGARSSTDATVRWHLGAFRTNNRNDILFVSDNAAGFGFFKNFGRTRRQGIEAGVGSTIDAWSFGVDYTLLDATYRSAETVDGSSNSTNDQALAGFPGTTGTIRVSPGDRIPLVPRQIAKAFVRYDPNAQWSVGVDVQAVGRSYARGNENNAHRADGVHYLGGGTSGGYAVLNLSADYHVTKRLKLYAEVDNLLDRSYTTAAQLGATGIGTNGAVVARPFPANANGDFPLRNSTFYAPGAPRLVMVGVRYRFAD